MAGENKVKMRTEAQVKQAFKDEKGVDPENPIYSAGYNDWLQTQPEWNAESGIAQFANPENRENVANSEANANKKVQQLRTDYDNAETNNDREARDRAEAEAAELRRKAVLAQTSFNPPPVPAKRSMPTVEDIPEDSETPVDSFVDTSDLDTSEVPIEEPKKHDYISTLVRNRKKNAETRVGTETETNPETETSTETETNSEPETPPEPAPAPETETETLPEEDLSDAGVTQEDIDNGNVDETNVDAAEGSVKENGFDPETADEKAIREAEQLGTWDKVSIGLSVASSILSALTLGILPPIDFRKFKNTDQKLEQIQQYQKDKRDAAVINNLQKEAESEGITDPQEIRQYVNDRFNSQSRNEQRTQDFNIQNKELDTEFAKGMKTLEHNLEMRKLDKQTINKIKEDTNSMLGEIKKLKAQGNVELAKIKAEAELKDWLAENQSNYDASTQAAVFTYWCDALHKAGLPINEENIRRMSRALQGATNTVSGGFGAGPLNMNGTSTY